MKTLIYDCEIIRCIPNKSGMLARSFEYCKGWEDFEGMGISVIGTMDVETKTALAYIAPNFTINPYVVTQMDEVIYKATGKAPVFPLEGFANCLKEYDQIIGFNSKRFDDNLCQANGIKIFTTFDLLEEVRIKAYGSPHWEDCPKGRSYALGALGEANGFPKTGSGELAPQLWQQGRHREVVRYCLNDVKITYELWRLFCDGKLKDPNTGKFL